MTRGILNLIINLKNLYGTLLSTHPNSDIHYMAQYKYVHKTYKKKYYVSQAEILLNHIYKRE